jgi:Protein of unknown function (DUF1706)
MQFGSGTNVPNSQEAKVERKTFLLGLLKQAHEMELSFTDALSDQERAQIGTLEEWSAKDMTCHNAAWKARLADNLLAVSEARSPTRTEDVNHQNETFFREHHGKTWDEALRMAAGAFQRVVAQVDSLGEQELESCEEFPWQRDRPLWRLIVGNSYIHPIAHMAEFYRNRGNRENAGKMIGEMARSMAGLDGSPVWQGNVKYNLACHHALLGAKAEAIRELLESLVLDPELADWSKQDPDLDSIRGEPEYQAIYKS